MIGTLAGVLAALAGGIIVMPLLAIHFELPMHQITGVTLLQLATSVVTSIYM